MCLTFYVQLSVHGVVFVLWVVCRAGCMLDAFCWVLYIGLCVFSVVRVVCCVFPAPYVCLFCVVVRLSCEICYALCPVFVVFSCRVSCVVCCVVFARCWMLCLS